jgi:hypothetical protein
MIDLFCSPVKYNTRVGWYLEIYTVRCGQRYMPIDNLQAFMTETGGYFCIEMPLNNLMLDN